ncbi:hypothetical protein L1049_021636 [Liquidambar formosana]|uniref:Uncharacterized protein n=1 Tax=Liquidambar formosana TaxID=63359 RepID=A0AAP0N7C9_LIQFO
MLGHLLHHFCWTPPEGVKPEEIGMTENPGLVTYMRDPLQAVPTPTLPTHLYKRVAVDENIIAKAFRLETHKDPPSRYNSCFLGVVTGKLIVIVITRDKITVDKHYVECATNTTLHIHYTTYVRRWLDLETAADLLTPSRAFVLGSPMPLPSHQAMGPTNVST